jgi:integrase
MKFTKEYRAQYGKKVWGFRGRIGKRRVQIYAWESRDEAVRAADDLKRQSIEETYGITPAREPVTLAQLVAEYVKDLDTDNNKNHKRKKVILEAFRDHVGGERLVATLEEPDALSFKRRRLAESALKPNSINRELEAVASMFNRVGSFFPSLKNWKHPRLPYEGVEGGRERVITGDEESRLLAALRAPRRPGRARTASTKRLAGEQVLAYRARLVVADLFELAPHVGMRRTELRLLEKGWIDFDAALVRLPAHVTKKRRARDVPLNEVALRILHRRCAQSPHPRYVFTNARGTNVLGEYQLYRAIRKAAAGAGVTYGQRVEGGFTLHDTRHTAATRMLHRGNDLATVADVLGHSKETMTMRYSHSTLESRRRAVASLARKSEGPDDEAATKSEG